MLTTGDEKKSSIRTKCHVHGHKTDMVISKCIQVDLSYLKQRRATIKDNC